MDLGVKKVVECVMNDWLVSGEAVKPGELAGLMMFLPQIYSKYR